MIHPFLIIIDRLLYLSLINIFARMSGQKHLKQVLCCGCYVLSYKYFQLFSVYGCVDVEAFYPGVVIIVVKLNF